MKRDVFARRFLNRLAQKTPSDNLVFMQLEDFLELYNYVSKLRKEIIYSFAFKKEGYEGTWLQRSEKALLKRLGRFSDDVG